MERRSAVILVAGLLAFLAFAAWFDITGRSGQSNEPAPGADAPAATPDAAPSPLVDEQTIGANRNERQGPAWSPADLEGADGKPLTLGNVIPGAFQPVRAGMDVQEAVDLGYLERDPQREQACEGTFWKWKGQWSQGLDVIVGTDRQIVSLGMARAGLETPEGISVGNTYAAVDNTYGDRLEGPVRMDYGQAGVFLRDGDNWVGFGFDNEPGRLVDTSRVAFIEVSRGNRPGLIRDGC
ncbi:MAG TPA: hypothetical protein VJ782_01320 [Aeromicrobium sp.]|nr:hypothetical protein [Aeromicrobium sp.]